MLCKRFQLQPSAAAPASVATVTSAQDGKSPDRKRSRIAAAGFGSPGSESEDEEDDEEEPSPPRTKREAVERETAEYKEVPRKAASDNNLPQFWNGRTKMNPGYSRCALAYLGCLPGAGGLECDIGLMSDIISVRRGSLDPGLIEV